MEIRNSVSLTELCLIALLITIAGGGVGCRKNVPVEPIEKPPTAPPPPKPTATLSAAPTTIQKGKSSTLTWSTIDATNVSINQGIGDVSTSGSRSVSPSSSMNYTLTAKGEGGTATASARVTVTTPPTPVTRGVPKESKLTVEELFARNVKDIYFDYDQSQIRDDARATLAAASRFLRENPQIRFTVEGHCDERGSEEYNLGLGDNRANAVLTHLSSMGISASRLKTISYGKEKPQCTESNEACWQKNRRAHFVLSR